MTDIYIIIFSFSLGLFRHEILTLFNKLFTFLNIKFSNKILNFFHVFTNTFSILFKYLFYLYIIYEIFSVIYNYIYIDYNYVLSNFDDLVNLSTNEYNVINNNTTNIYNVDKAIGQVPRAVATYGAYKAGMSVAKNVPNIGTKGLVIASIGALSAGSVTFGSIIGEELANRVFKDKNKFIQFFNNSNNINLELFPYNLLFSMSTINMSCISFLLIIINIFIVDYIKNKNLLNYLPDFIKNNKIYSVIEFLYNRYIKLWSISKKPILIISFIGLLIGLSIIQLGLYLILHN
jgi:hypothetical protein